MMPISTHLRYLIYHRLSTLKLQLNIVLFIFSELGHVSLSLKEMGAGFDNAVVQFAIHRLVT